MCKKRSAQNTRKKSRKQQIYQSRRLCEVRERVREEMCSYEECEWTQVKVEIMKFQAPWWRKNIKIPIVLSSWWLYLKNNCKEKMNIWELFNIRMLMRVSNFIEIFWSPPPLAIRIFNMKILEPDLILLIWHKRRTTIKFMTWHVEI